MKLYRKKRNCCGCGACAATCPKNAIHMKMDREGFLYPQADPAICTDCGKCLTVCPLKEAQKPQPYCRYYGAHSLDRKIRERSSSGGIFSLLAEYVLKRSGSVFAVGFGENMKVMHKEIRTYEEIDLVRRSKYVQSDPGTTFCGIKERLLSGSWVLFVGTLCQAEALLLYLGRPYSRLIIADLICYGAASPGVWQSYVRYLEERHHGKIQEYSFRDKRNRDNGHTVSWKTDKEERVSLLNEDPYSRMYFKNLIIRPACFRCRYCRPQRNSDLTLGDFWGLERIRRDLDDGMGNSLVIVHTEKGENVWKEIKKRCVTFECPEDAALQPRLQTATEYTWKRAPFMWGYKHLAFERVLKFDQRNGKLYEWLKKIMEKSGWKTKK